MEKIKELLRAVIEYAKANPVLVAILAGLFVLAIVLIVAIAAASSKAKKAKKAAKQAPAVEAEAKPPVQTEAVKATPAKAETTKKTATPKMNAPVKAEAAKTEKVVEKSEKKTAPVEKAQEAEKLVKVSEKPTAKKAEKAKKPAPTEKLEKIEEIEDFDEAEEWVEESRPAKRKTTPAAAKKTDIKINDDVDETLEMFEDYDEDEDEFLRDHYDEGEMDRIAKYKGKWVICRLVTNDKESEEMYFFELHASNGEKLLSSEEYTSYAGALRGIETHKTNILNGNLKITLSKKGDYIFKLLSGKNMLLCMGENYPTKARCESAMESTIRFAETAVIDENVQDIFIKVPAEDDTPVQPLPDGCTGKWIISSTETKDGDRIYYFELFANNGEKLLASEEYMTYIGAVNGIQTHKKNIASGNFRISLTKRGDYIYKLLNGNGQLLCLGEHYRTKRLCKNAVESVKRFAMSSPVLTSDEHIQ